MSKKQQNGVAKIALASFFAIPAFIVGKSFIQLMIEDGFHLSGFVFLILPSLFMLAFGLFFAVVGFVEIKESLLKS